MFSLWKRVATFQNYFGSAALRLCWLLGSKRLRPRLQNMLQQRWVRALTSAPAAAIRLQDLTIYTPIRLNVSSDQRSVTWLKTQQLSATDPFFEQIIFRSWMSQIRPRLCRTGIDTLFELSKIDPGLAPTGFVFHLSRCGSTLVSNILSVPANCLVLSEPFIVSLLLMTPEESLPLELRANILRALVSVLGRRQSANQKHLFLKFTSWNVLYLDFIKKVYPEVPWIFLYRHPLEVAVSNLKDQMAWSEAKNAPGLIQQHLGISDASKLNAEEFYARALGKYGHAALSGLDSNARLVSYRDLTESFIPGLLSFFKIEATAEELQRMKRCFQFHSKDATKTRRHVDDSHKKVSIAPAHLKEMVDRHAIAAYEALELKRKATDPNFVRIDYEM